MEIKWLITESMEHLIPKDMEYLDGYYGDQRVDNIKNGVSGLPRKPETFGQCCFNVEPTSKTVAQLNPIAAKLFNLNFHPLEVVSR